MPGGRPTDFTLELAAIMFDRIASGATLRLLDVRFRCTKADGDAALLARWDRLMEAVERPYAYAILREKNRYIRQAAESFERTRRLLDAELHDHAANMLTLAERYQGIAIRLGLSAALDGHKARLPTLRRKDWMDGLWFALLRQWVATHAGRRAQETAATTRDDLQRVISQAVAPSGECDLVRVAADMLKVRGLSAFRAQTIAQTETHNAMMFAAHAGAERAAASNVVAMLKRWVPVADERTRINHSVMAGVSPIPMDQDFLVGGERMHRPGDPRGSAVNTVRCRCVLAFSVQE